MRSISPRSRRSAQAVAGGEGGFQTWRSVSLSRRQDLFSGIRELVTRRHGEIAAILTDEHGKVLSDAKGEVQRGLEVIEYACGIPTCCRGTSPSRASTESTSTRSASRSASCAGITPFNFPAMVPMWMWAPRSRAVTRSPQAVREVPRPRRRTSPSSSTKRACRTACFNVVHGDKVAVDAISSIRTSLRSASSARLRSRATSTRPAPRRGSAYRRSAARRTT